MKTENKIVPGEEGSSEDMNKVYTERFRAAMQLIKESRKMKCASLIHPTPGVFSRRIKPRF